MMENAEATLIKQVLNGRRECYRPLVEKYQRKIYLLAYSMLGIPAEAQDLSQEAFLLAYKKLRELKDRQKFSPWLYGITRNLCYAALRKKRVVEEPLDDILEREIPANVVSLWPAEEEGIDLRHVLLEKLNALPEKFRVLLKLKYLEEYSYQEIGEMLDLPIDLVRSRLFEGRRLLREEVKESWSRKYEG